MCTCGLPVSILIECVECNITTNFMKIKIFTCVKKSEGCVKCYRDFKLSKCLSPCMYVQVLLGNRGWMSENGVQVNLEMETLMQQFEEQGQTVVLAAVDGT